MDKDELISTDGEIFDKKEEKPNQEERMIEAKNFFSTQKKKLGLYAKKGESVVQIDFNELSEHSPELSEDLINKPEETIRILELALAEGGIISDPRIRLESISKTQELKIRNIRAKNLGTMISIEGIVRQASEVRPQVINARFECPSCGTILSILQVEKRFQEPNRCSSCGRRGGFRLLTKEMVDAQRLVIEESPDALSGGEQPKRMQVFLKEDLVDPKMEDRTTPGSKVRVLGILKEISLPLPTGIQTRFDLAIESNNVIPLEESFDDFAITEEEENQIKELATEKNIVEKLAKSISPSVWGYPEIKEALALQLFGGVQKRRSDGTLTRGDIHILMVGDPGVAKSVMLKFISTIAPKGRYVSGKSASGAGLTATVVKDEFLRGWALEAGAMVLSNKGLVCLHPDSRVLVNGESKKISDLFKEELSKKIVSKNQEAEINDLNCQVVSLLGDNLDIGKERSTMLRRKKYEGEILNITTSSGFNIKLTPDHKLINGKNILWTEAQNLGVGDSLLAPLKLPEFNKNLFILDIINSDWIVCLDKSEKEELKELIFKKYGNLSKFNKKYDLDANYLSGGKQLKVGVFKHILEEFNIYDSWKKRLLSYGRSNAGERLKISEITPELAYFIGFVLGDGHMKIDKKHSLVQITQSLKNQKQIDKLKTYFDTFSNISLKQYTREIRSEIRGKGVVSTCVSLYSGSNLISYLVDYFIGSKLNNIHLLNNSCIKGFIAGCLDSDGCVSIKNYTKKGKIYHVTHIEFLISNDSEINKNLVLAIRRLDCYSKYLAKSPISIVRITGNVDVNQFLKEVGEYSVKIKDIPLRKTNISSASSKLPIEVVSVLCKRIIAHGDTNNFNKLGLSSTLYDYANMKRVPSREQLIKLKERLSLRGNISKEIECLVKRDTFIDEIIKVEKENYCGYVYDLFVPEKHNFICDGLIVHNCIDELEKMDENDRSTMHEALEQQTVTISKANVQATLNAKTAVLAAANPKFGRFDPTDMIAKQVNLAPSLLNRFDVLFILRDLPDRERDERIAAHVLSEHKQDTHLDLIDRDLLRKYIAYAHQKYKPVLSSEAADKIKRFYVGLRNQSTFSTNDTSNKPIPISARQLEALIRLAEANAKARLSKKVEVEDAERAIKLVQYYMMQVGYDEETKSFDIDKISGNPASKRGKIFVVKELLEELENRLGKLIPQEELEKLVGDKMKKDELEEAIEKLLRAGDIFRPKKGYLQRV